MSPGGTGCFAGMNVIARSSRAQIVRLGLTPRSAPTAEPAPPQPEPQRGVDRLHEEEDQRLAREAERPRRAPELDRMAKRRRDPFRDPAPAAAIDEHRRDQAEHVGAAPIACRLDVRLMIEMKSRADRDAFRHVEALAGE